MLRRAGTIILLTAAIAFAPVFGQEKAPLKVFISVDMEGIGGIGTSQIVRSSGKDYALGRELMTREVNAVVEAVFAQGPAEILVNDSHGDMQNLMHTELDERVTYIQGNIKPLGMVQGLDETFDAAIFLGYHARAGDLGGFLAHTGSGAVKGLWINDTEVGEGGMNAAYAGAMGVPVILASGDKDFTEEFQELVETTTVITKEAVTPQVARLIHPSVVQERLAAGTREALGSLDDASLFDVGEGDVRIRMRFSSTTRADVLQAIPGMNRVDGYTVSYTAQDMDEAYRLIRLMYKYIDA